MNILNIEILNNLSELERFKILKNTNNKLESFSIDKRMQWIKNNLPMPLVLSSSFGIQSAVSLHLVTKFFPEIPVIVIDTGYLFPETYSFIDELTIKFNLNLQVFRSYISPAWQETRYGKLWEKGLNGINQYNYINKIQPMNQALQHLKAKTWIAGLRREQSHSRAKLSILSIQKKIFKILPIVDWNNFKIHEYIKLNKLKYHTLWEQGYVSVGDIHTSQKLQPGMTEEETRFFGLKRECGLHEK